MIENYYDSLITHIKALIQAQDFQAAKRLIEDELSMPFVPRDTLKQLEELKQLVDFELAAPVSTRMMSPQEVYEALKSGSEKSYKALEVLANSNIRNYLDIIQDLLDDESVNHTLKALLIEQLNCQQINSIVTMVDKGKVTSFVPSQLPLALNQKNLKEIEALLEKYIPSNPSFLTQAKMVLVNVAYDRYPRTIEEADIEKISFSIMRYVYLAYGDEAGCKQFLRLHNVEENELEEYSF